MFMLIVRSGALTETHKHDPGSPGPTGSRVYLWPKKTDLFRELHVETIMKKLGLFGYREGLGVEVP